MTKDASGSIDYAGEAGLTLVELLIVLFIISLGWFSLLPRLDPTGPGRADTPLHAMNTFLEQVRHAALLSGRFQEVRVDQLEGRLAWGETFHRLPMAVTRCTINAQPCSRPGAFVRIYPPGYMDRFDLTFPDGMQWATRDLDVRLAAVDRQ